MQELIDGLLDGRPARFLIHVSQNHSHH
jgi:hypothetical protein